MGGVIVEVDGTQITESRPCQIVGAALKLEHAARGDVESPPGFDTAARERQRRGALDINQPGVVEGARNAQRANLRLHRSRVVQRPARNRRRTPQGTGLFEEAAVVENAACSIRISHTGASLHVKHTARQDIDLAGNRAGIIVQGAATERGCPSDGQHAPGSNVTVAASVHRQITTHRYDPRSRTANCAACPVQVGEIGRRRATNRSGA